MTFEELMVLASTPGGTHCPCCKKFVKVYCRKFNSGMAYALIQIYQQARKTNNEWLNVGKFLIEECEVWPSDYGKLVWWGLLEKHSGKAEDGNSNALYRMTRKGSMFVKRRIKVLSHAVEYMSEVQRFEGKEISIVEALEYGNKFKYDELMHTAPA